MSDIKTIGEAIDYVMKDKNRRIECRVEYPKQGHKNQWLRYTNRPEFLSVEWVEKDGQVVRDSLGDPRNWPTIGWGPCDANWFDLERATGFFRTREMPPAPAGFSWTPVAGFVQALRADDTGEQVVHIADTRERDIQAARVAEFDSRPKV